MIITLWIFKRHGDKTATVPTGTVETQTGKLQPHRNCRHRDLTATATQALQRNRDRQITTPQALQKQTQENDNPIGTEESWRHESYRPTGITQIQKYGSKSQIS